MVCQDQLLRSLILKHKKYFNVYIYTVQVLFPMKMLTSERELEEYGSVRFSVLDIMIVR